MANRISTWLMKASVIAALALWLLACVTADANAFGSVATTATAKHPVLAMRPYYMFVGNNATPLEATGPDDPAESGDAIVAWRDVSGVTVRDAAQATAADQPLMTAGGGVNFADTSDHVEIASYGVAGTMIVGTSLGTAVYEVNSTAFTDISALGRKGGSVNPAGVLYFMGMFPTLTAAQKAEVKSYAVSLGATADFNGAASLLGAWFFRTEITNIDIVGASSCSSFQWAFRGCTSLVSVPLIDTSSGSVFAGICEGASSITSFPFLDFSLSTSCERLCYGCSSLVTVPANLFDTCPTKTFNLAFYGCALSQTSVDNILVSIDTAGQINGTLDINGGTSSAPSATGLAAKTSLEGKGWTVTVNP